MQAGAETYALSQTQENLDSLVKEVIKTSKLHVTASTQGGLGASYLLSRPECRRDEFWVGSRAGREKPRFIAWAVSRGVSVVEG